MPGVDEKELAEAAQLSSLADETPEGRSIVVLAKEKYGLRGRELAPHEATFIPFTAQTRMSGVDFDGREVRKGAADAIEKYVLSFGKTVPPELTAIVESISKAGGTPLVVAEDRVALGVIHLKDIVKGGMVERFNQMRQMGIKTIMITGDNPLTAATIAREAGVDDFLAQATPEDKMALIKKEQAGGKLVAMTGDGTNDAPALAQADVGVAMNTGTQAAKEAGNMVDLDSNPTKLIEIVEIGKQLLMTRGALTTFSIANDVAKYFAIIPAMFSGVATLSVLNSLNIMGLRTPQSAILSAVIFNALVIIALIPLALRGVKYRPMSAASLLRRNLLIYGLGGLVVPFIGIKIIDVIIHAIGLASRRPARLSLNQRKDVTQMKKPTNRNLNDNRDDGSAGVDLSPRRDRSIASDLSRQSERATHQARRRHYYRLAHHWPTVLFARLLPFTPFCGWCCWLRCRAPRLARILGQRIRS